MDTDKNGEHTRPACHLRRRAANGFFIFNRPNGTRKTSGSETVGATPTADVSAFPLFAFRFFICVHLWQKFGGSG
jgi:hypothetical protein